MGYMVEASELPADVVPQQWCDDNGCEDAGDVWVEYGGLAIRMVATWTAQTTLGMLYRQLSLIVLMRLIMLVR